MENYTVIPILTPILYEKFVSRESSERNIGEFIPGRLGYIWEKDLETHQSFGSMIEYPRRSRVIYLYPNFKKLSTIFFLVFS